MIKTDKSSTSEPMSMPSARKRWVKRLVFWGKIFVTLLVLGWISYRLYSDWTEISRYHWKLHYCWLIGAGGFYLTAFFAAAVFWYLSLRWLGQIPTFFQAVRSYYVSQLGKYIPGKAMVVVIRSGMVAGEKVRAGVAAVAVFYETLTMMSAGAFISALIVLLWFREHYFYSLLAIGAMLIVGIPILPPVFVRILKILKIGKDDTGFQEHLQRFTFRSILVGMGLMSVLWILLGGSLWATILGLGIETGGLLEHLPRFVSATALAIVLGFAVPVSPGGLGIREAVLSILLIPYFQDILNIPANMSFTIQAETLAMLVSLVQRVVTILAELAIVAPLLFFPWLVRMVHSSIVEQPGESTAEQR